MFDQQQPGSHALYSCVTADGHHFVSLKVACTGGTMSGTYVRTEGWLLTKPGAASGGSGASGASADTLLFECQSASAADFVSSQATCEGQSSAGAGTSAGTRIGSLGYALAQQP